MTVLNIIDRGNPFFLVTVKSESNLARKLKKEKMAATKLNSYLSQKKKRKSVEYATRQQDSSANYVKRKGLLCKLDNGRRMYGDGRLAQQPI